MFNAMGSMDSVNTIREHLSRPGVMIEAGSMTLTPLFSKNCIFAVHTKNTRVSILDTFTPKTILKTALDALKCNFVSVWTGPEFRVMQVWFLAGNQVSV